MYELRTDGFALRNLILTAQLKVQGVELDLLDPPAPKAVTPNPDSTVQPKTTH